MEGDVRGGRDLLWSVPGGVPEGGVPNISSLFFFLQPKISLCFSHPGVHGG